MTWARLDDNFIDHPKLLGLPRGVRLLYVEGIVWCCKHETDGEVPRGAVPRFTDEPDLEQAAELLVAAGLWGPTSTGWQINGFLDAQISRARLTERRSDDAFRQERKRLHDRGDHSTCTRGSTFCPAGELDLSVSRRDTGRDSRPVSRPVSQVVSRTPVPTRPVPTSREGRGRGEADAPPPQGSAGAAMSVVVMPLPADLQSKPA